MRIMITGGTGFVSTPTIEKIIHERLGQDIEFMVVQDRLGVTPVFSDTPTKTWVGANLDEVHRYWWRDIIQEYNIDTIFYMEGTLNDRLYIPTQDAITKYQESDAIFTNYAVNSTINIMVLSTDKLYIDDDFPNVLNPIMIQQPEGNQDQDPDLSLLLQYASSKLSTELTLLSNTSEFLRIIRPISIVGPNQGVAFPLTSDINKAYTDKDISSYGQGDRGMTFTHVLDLVKFILSDNLFNAEVYLTLTSRIVNVCRYQNYLPETNLIEKIRDKLNSDSSIIYNSTNDNYPYIIRTPQVRNMVRIDIPRLSIEYIIEDILDDIDPVDNYLPIVINTVGFVTSEYLYLDGTVEPLSNISILISTGETLSTTADENGDWSVQNSESGIYHDPGFGTAYATLEGVQFSTVSFDIPAA